MIYFPIFLLSIIPRFRSIFHFLHNIYSNIRITHCKQIKTIDGCLYGAGCGYVDKMRENLFEFMYMKGWVPRSESAEAVWWPLFQKYNQTKRGFREAGFEYDPQELSDFMRQGCEAFISLDAPLDAFLSSIPHRKFICSNAAERQVIKVLAILGISHHFEHIYGGDFMGVRSKPMKEAFEAVLEDIGIKAENVVFFEDSVKNLATCYGLGMRTVLVNGPTAVEEGFSDEQAYMMTAIVPTLSIADGGHLRQAIPDLFTTTTSATNSASPNSASATAPTPAAACVA